MAVTSVNCPSLDDTGTPGGLLSVTVERSGDVSVVRAAGEIDLYTAQALRIATGAAVSTGAIIAVDLSAVTFLAAEGLSILVDTRKLAQRRGTRLYLIARHRAVLRPLELTGLTATFTIVDDLSGVDPS